MQKNSGKHSLSLFFCCLGLVFQFILALCFSHYIRQGPFSYGPGLGRKLLVWDGLWYRDIAENGYSWAKNGVEIGNYHNPAFFPLYPLIEKLVSFLFSFKSPWVFISPGVFFGFVSVFSFSRLCNQLLNEKQATWAIRFYCFWPYSCFFFAGYPTGLINLCVCESLIAWSENKKILSMLWCGVVSAAGPLPCLLPVSLLIPAFFKDIAKKNGRIFSQENLAKISLYGIYSIISEFGIISYSVYLYYRFGNPFIFLEAQRAWGKNLDLIIKVILLFNPEWYYIPVKMSVVDLFKVYQGKFYLPYFILESVIQKAFGSILVVFSYISIISFSFKKSSIVSNKSLSVQIIASSLIFLLGYMFFIGTTEQGINSAGRLIFICPAIPIASSFLFSGHIPKLILLASFLLIGTMNFTFLVSGYPVV